MTGRGRGEGNCPRGGEFGSVLKVGARLGNGLSLQWLETAEWGTWT